jgi:hypothetical protein
LRKQTPFLSKHLRLETEFPPSGCEEKPPWMAAAGNVDA